MAGKLIFITGVSSGLGQGLAEEALSGCLGAVAILATRLFAAYFDRRID